MTAVSCGGAVGTPSGILLTSAGAGLAWPVLAAPLPFRETPLCHLQTRVGTEGLSGAEQGDDCKLQSSQDQPGVSTSPAGTACPGRTRSQQLPFPVGPCGWELAQPLSLSWFWNSPHFLIHERCDTLSPDVWCEIREQKDPTNCTAPFKGP